MAKKTVNHLHKYKKVNIGSINKDYFVYQCMRPTCSHYIPVKQSEGKLCECNRCGEPMIINKVVLNGSNGGPMARPHCTECIERRKDKVEDVAAISAFLEGNKI